ncbi:hypothetical protein [Flavobacterium quisquiliarum]|uniref:Uncharacterized protein n=1 Tax=Flavobacterium quisquiliarum TaxID=1834436 RepID=A0ABV8W8G9_9FLAO|nr:hypothetical protein [Flavobacterium quisquiliarum]MBW1656285.1 hypothetical protein [Flavobacterium quisquiliarum]NWL02128.1 hypothetical protein [Flavobacterium collinsii]
MKKYLSLILFAFLLNGCDDGDLTVQEINFDNVTPVSCSEDNTLMYKLKSREAFLLQMPKTGGLVNDPGTYVYDIPTGGNGTYRAIYRAYDGALVADNICGLIPPSTPKVVEEWIATSGKINITTTQKTSERADDGSTKLIGYNYSINFTNITFAISNSKPQTYPTYPFGTFSSTVSVPASLSFDSENASTCSGTNLNRVYNYSAAFFVMIDNIDPDLLKNEVTPPSQPRTQLVGSTKNKVYYKSVQKETGSFSKDYFCNASFPTSPSIAEDWIGQNGDDTKKTGMIEVTTTLVGDTYYHSIILKRVTMLKGNSTFDLPTDFSLGRLEVKP